MTDPSSTDKPSVWLSNTSLNATANHTRAQIMKSLPVDTYEIGNRFGTQKIKPSTVQSKVFDRHQAFVFGPNPTPQDRYLASCFLACLTKNDASLTGKPVVIVNSDGSWDGFICSADEFKAMGVGKNALSDTITVVDSADKVPGVLAEKLANPLDLSSRSSLHSTTAFPTCMEDLRRRTDIPEPKRKVVVFCSASLKATDDNGQHLDANAYIHEFHELGRKLAKKGIGIVYGGGAHSLMGALANGAAEENGWVEVVTLPRFFEREGLPNDIFSKVEFADDVHARVEKMMQAEGVAAYIIGPGSEGTLHEAETLHHAICSKDPLMKTRGGLMKPVYMLDLAKHKEGEHFWDQANEHLGYKNVFSSIEPSVDQLLEKMEKDNFAVPSPPSQKSIM